jgi:hypothetical protein
VCSALSTAKHAAVQLFPSARNAMLRMQRTLCSSHFVKWQRLPSNVALLQVPVTIKTTYTCDKVTTEDNTMIIKTNGVLNSVDSALYITYGRG